jgi:hypothetical protein
MITISCHKGNANQSQTKIPPHLSPKNITNHRCWQGCGEKGALITAGGNASYCNHSGKQYRGLLKKTKHDPAIPLLGYTQRNETQVTP